MFVMLWILRLFSAPFRLLAHPHRHRRRARGHVRRGRVSTVRIVDVVGEQRLKDARATARRERREAQTTLMPPAVWVVFAVLTVVAAVSNLAAIPGLVIIGAGIGWYAHVRRQRVARNLAAQGRL